MIPLPAPPGKTPAPADPGATPGVTPGPAAPGSVGAAIPAELNAKLEKPKHNANIIFFMRMSSSMLQAKLLV
jgi:hypothetical protein